MARKARDYMRDNREAVRIILGDASRYEGLCLEWAKLWASRHAGVSHSIEGKEEEYGSPTDQEYKTSICR